MLNNEKTSSIEVGNTFSYSKLNRIFPLLPNYVIISLYLVIVMIGAIAITVHDHYNFPDDHRSKQFITENFSDLVPIKLALEDNLKIHGQFMLDKKNTANNKLVINVSDSDHNLKKCDIKANRLHVVTYDHSAYKACSEAAYYFNGILYQEEQKSLHHH